MDFALRGWRRDGNEWRNVVTIAPNGLLTRDPPESVQFAVDRVEIGFFIPGEMSGELRDAVASFDTVRGGFRQITIFPSESDPKRAARATVEMKLLQFLVVGFAPLLTLKREFPDSSAENHRWQYVVPGNLLLLHLLLDPAHAIQFTLSGHPTGAPWLAKAIDDQSPDPLKLTLVLEEIPFQHAAGAPAAAVVVPCLTASFPAASATTRIGALTVRPPDTPQPFPLPPLPPPPRPALVQHRPLWTAVSDGKTIRLDPESLPFGASLCSVQRRLQEKDVLAAWNRAIVEPHVRALRTVLDDVSISFLPSFPTPTSTEPWQAFFVVDPSNSDDVAEPCGIRSMRPSTDKKSIPIEMPGACALDGSPLRWLGRILHGESETAVWTQLYLARSSGGFGGETAGAFDISFAVFSRDVGTPPPSVRVGAAELTFESSWKHEGAQEKDVPVAHRSRVRVGLPDVGRPRIEQATVRMSASRFSPCGQDLAEEEIGVARFEETGDGDDGVRETPLVLPLRDATEKRALRLEIDEQTSDGRRHTLELDVLADGDEVAEGSAVAGRALVLDGAPLNVAGVAWSADVAREEGSITVARWRSVSPAGARWTLQQIGGRPTWLSMPSQALGESMERSRAPGEGVGHGERVDIRLAPAAQFGLRVENVERRYVEIPWNLRRLLERSGDGLPGVRLEALRVELNYGIQTWALFEGSLPRFAEAFARLGRMPGLLPPPISNEPSEYGRARDAWRRLTSAYARRLAVFELIDPSGRADDPVVETGAGAVLRDAALQLELRTPYAPGGDKEAEKLGGGATWGLESRAVHDAVTSRTGRKAVATRLEALRFSAVGGWGNQAVTFDSGRTVIRSSVDLGRAARVAFERTGRIGVFWNRAKHVIVYERTTVPTRQFCRAQTAHLGRPMLRKVQEYVEILQATRSYPEGVEDAKRRPPAGFVQGCTFVTKRIPVDGKWGNDVASSVHPEQLVGWRVPLWRDPAADPDVDPDVYPRPMIVLEVAADGPGAESKATGRIGRPDQLFFFTSTVEGETDDTDSWKPVENVDFADHAEPSPENVPNGDPRNLDAPMPDAPPVQGRHAPFTFVLEPTRRPVNVVAGFTDKPMGAAISNVTMMRSDATTEVLHPALAAADQIEDGVAALLDKVREAVPRGREVLDDEMKRIKALVEGLPSAPFKDLQNLGDQLALPTDTDLCGRLKGVVTSGESLAKKAVETAFRDADELIDLELRKLPYPTDPNAPRDELHHGVDRLRTLIHAHAGELDKSLAGAGDFLAGGMDRALDAVRRARALIDAEMAGIRAAFVAAPAEIDARRAAVLARLSVAEGRLFAYVQNLSSELHASLRERFAKIASDIDEKVLGLLDARVRSALDEVFAKLPQLDAEGLQKDLDRLETEIGGKLDFAAAVVSAMPTAPKAGEAVRELRRLLDDGLARWDQALRIGADAPSDGGVEEFKKEVKARLDRVGAGAVDDLKKAVDGVLARAGAKGKAVVASKTYDDAWKGLKQRLADLTTEIAGLLDAVTDKNIEKQRVAVRKAAETAAAAVRQRLAAAQAVLDAFDADVVAAMTELSGKIQDAVKVVAGHVAEVEKFVSGSATDVTDFKNRLKNDLKGTALKTVDDALSVARKAVDAEATDFGAALDAGVVAKLAQAEAWAADWRGRIDKLADSTATSVADFAKEITAAFGDAVAIVEKAAGSVLDEIERILRGLNAELSRGVETAARSLGAVETAVPPRGRLGGQIQADPGVIPW